MFFYSQSTIHLTKNQMYRKIIKHIDFRMHFSCNVTTRGDMLLENITTSDNQVDMLTKALPSIKFKHYLDIIGILKF